MSGLFFKADEWSFLDPDEFESVPKGAWKALLDATADLAAAAETTRINLQKAPLASWVLARFAALSASTSFPSGFIRREGELGGFRIRLLAVRGTDPVAHVRFAAEGGVSTLHCKSADLATAAATAKKLIELLMAEPQHLERCEVSVKAMELGGHRNEYGYDGRGFLGHFNVYR